MDVETTHAIEELGSRIDRLETSLRQEIKQEVENAVHQLRGEIKTRGDDLRGEMAELGANLRGEMAELGANLRGEMAELGANLRGEMAELRANLRGEMATVRDDLALNWSRTQLLFEAVRDDIKLLGEVSGRRPRRSLVGNRWTRRPPGPWNVMPRDSAGARAGEHVVDKACSRDCERALKSAMPRALQRAVDSIPIA